MTGLELRALLDERNWTQTAFAQHIGKTDRTVRRWMTIAEVPRSIELLALRLPHREVVTTRQVLFREVTA